jgi:ribonuclease BN (tRNA processing enzyme)
MPKNSVVRSRRALLKDVAVVTGLGITSPFFQTIAAIQEASAQTKAKPEQEPSKGSTLILLGTQGGPGITLTRSQTASVLVVGNQLYLIDCGYGTLRALTQAGLSFNNLSHIFLTHLHNDHTSDVAALLSHKWTSGRAQETTVHGPYSTTRLVSGALEFFKGDTEIRMVDEGRTVLPESIFHGHDINLSRITEVFRDEWVTVRAVENTHFPERAKKKMMHRSLGYRFDMADRSIVFSGDTAYCKELVELAQNADVFVCEAMSVESYRAMEGAAKEAATKNIESVARHVIETHSTTEDAGRMAAEAKVKTVVLNHLIGGGNAKLSQDEIDAVFVESVKKFFSGKVLVGRDQMKI